MKKYLIALQYSPLDQELAFKLADLIADIQEQPTDLADFMFSYRNDSTPPSQELISKLKLKFKNVYTYKAVNFATGWPAGCNALALETYGEFFKRCRSKEWNYCAVQLMESDSVPLARDWIAQLSREWHECDWQWPLGNKQHILGAYFVESDGIAHCNGNCLISSDYLKINKAFKHATIAWDCEHKVSMMENARPSKLIYSDYQLCTERKPLECCEDLWKRREFGIGNPLHGEDIRPIFLHGPKTDQGIKCVRARFGLAEIPAD